MTHSFTDQVIFRPWVGSRYGQANEVGLPERVLILGESHYGDGKPDPNLTEAVVREWLDGHTPRRFLTNISQALIGRHYSEIDHEAVWQSVAFYNFVQTYAAKGPRRRPTNRMFEEAEVPFFEILATLAPTHVLACGKRLWDWLPMTHFRDEGADDRGWYELGDLRIPILYIHHPSSGFSAPRWAPIVREFLSG